MLAMVMKEIVRFQRKFLWGWGADSRKNSVGIVGKDVRTKRGGGLGMVNIRRFNIALLGKWIWRLGYDKHGLWKEVVDSKYGGWRDLQSKRNRCSDSLWWRDLKEVWSLDEWRDKLEANFSWEVGNGREIRFWEDRWAGNTTLKELFSRLHSTCLNKDSFA